MKQQQKEVCIVIPTYNEQAVLPKLYDRLTQLADNTKQCTFEFLFVIDGATDTSLEIVTQLAQSDTRVSYVQLSRNFGQEIAILAGLDNTKADAVVIIDADLQDPPELIPSMLEYWQQGYDDVYARRVSRAGETWLKKLTAHTFYRLLQKTTNITLQRDTGNFRLLDKKCVEALTRLRESQRYTKGMFSWIGFRKKEITYHRDPRAAGETKWNYQRMINLAMEGITSFTTFPLKLSSLVGLVISFLSFLYILLILARTTFLGVDVPGYASLMAVILFLGGMQLLSLGVIGEYIGRIFNETKQRPLYFVQDIHRSDDKK